MRQSRRSEGATAIGLALLVLAGCTSHRVPVSTETGTDEAGPALVIERFLQSANAIAGATGVDAEGDEMERLTARLDTMTRLFGTREDPIRDLYPRDEVEQWMFALADVLRHDGFRIEGTRLVPGRVGEAMMVTVRLRTSGRDVDVPFTLVQTREGGWRIEQIELERITAGP